jgi:anaerobic selenocysteine-containing dehydrogenase
MIKAEVLKQQISRRAFNAGALAAAAVLAGCGGSDSDETLVVGGGGQDQDLSEDIFYEKNPVYRYGTTGHNCGGRCITKAQITADGRIVRFLTDETKYAYDGTSIDMENRNCTQSRACGRCRAYKGRLYHPGRLKFPLKQTKERGDMSGFIRISWNEALREIADRLHAVQGKYGSEAFHTIYACGSTSQVFQGASYDGVFSNYDWAQSEAIRLLGGNIQYSSDYSFHQGSYMGAYGGIGGFSGLANMDPSADDIAGTGKYLVLWGANIPTTHNPKAYPWVKGVEDMKKRDPNAKVIFIGPELSECGIAFADQWIRIKPYTDTALILAMIHEMIVNTVGVGGNLLSGTNPDTGMVQPALDLDYLDSMVYGFFDSPGYWHNEATGEIDLNEAAPDIAAGTPAVSGGSREFDLPPAGTFGSFTNSSGVNQRITWVDPVPDGKSWSAYIMGDDTRLTSCAYGSGNYTAARYTAQYPGITRNRRTCDYDVPAGTKYAYKQAIKTPKDPEWAERITGVPAATIRSLAKLYIDAGKAGDPIWNEWAGGMLKQAEGCTNLFAIQCLLAVTENWGRAGTGIANNAMGPSVDDAGKVEITAGDLTPGTWASVPQMPVLPRISVTQWHNAVKYAFRDELSANGYEPNIPDWGSNWNSDVAGDRIPYYHDGGVKSLVRRGAWAVPGGAPIMYPDTSVTPPRTYYEWENRLGTGTPIYSGYRFLLNTGGNIPANQHANTIDSTEMFKHLPTYGYATPVRPNVAEADAFYLVSFDNFMSPSVRYSDYVLPAKTNWEQESLFVIENNAGTLYVDSYVPGPGESMSTWDFARELIKAYGGASAAIEFTGDGPDTTFREIVQKKYNTVFNQPGVPGNIPAFVGKSWEEFLEKPIIHAKPKNNTPYGPPATSALRDQYEAAKSGGTLTGPNYFGIDSAAVDRGDILFGEDWFAETETCPRQSKRFHVYSGSLIWRYKNLFSAWHGHLPVAQQGQNNTDPENNPIVYPIPMYYDYHDYFREAYGLNDNSQLDGRYLLTTTHDRFRAHSSQSENPYLRELTHRVVNGGLYSGNDAGDYAVSDSAQKNVLYSPLNSLIGANGKPVPGAEKYASYIDIWVNDEDFAAYNDGELVKVENEIGAVYCTLRKTKRCVRGFVGLHQGAWFDPREIDGKIVDVGGCCNTLMASKPSRIDHGNAQQSAMVTITRVN